MVGKRYILKIGIYAEHSENISIVGNGIVNGAYWHLPDSNAHRFFIYIKWCKNVLLKGFTAVDGPFWHVVPAACDHVVIVHTFFRCIGDNDCFLSRFLEEDALSQEKGVHEIRKIYPSGHDWNVWRPCFTDFAQMIFR